MKKQLTIVILLVLGMIAVNAQVIVLRAGIGEITFTEEWNDAKYSEIYDSNIMIVVNLEKEIITISNKFEDKFVMINGKVESNNDNNGIERKDAVWNCVDKNGTSCIVIMSYYLTDTMFGESGMYDTRIRVAYTNVWYGYYCVTKSTSGFE